MEILFNEQDIVDSICVYVAMMERTQPEEIDVELKFDQTITALSVHKRFNQRHLEEQEILDAVATYLRDYHSFNPEFLSIELRFSQEDGIGASIVVN